MCHLPMKQVRPAPLQLMPFEGMTTAFRSAQKHLKASTRLNLSPWVSRFLFLKPTRSEVQYCKSTEIQFRQFGRMPTRRDKSFRAHWATPVVIDGYFYGCSGRNQPDSDFRCVRLTDGHVQWTGRRHERTSVLLVDGYLVVLGEYGRLELMHPNPKKLEVVASVDLSLIADPSDRNQLLEAPCWAAPILLHGLLYIRGNTNLICMELIPQPK